MRHVISIATFLPLHSNRGGSYITVKDILKKHVMTVSGVAKQHESQFISVTQR